MLDHREPPTVLVMDAASNDPVAGVSSRIWEALWFPERLGPEPALQPVEDALCRSRAAPRSYPMGHRFYHLDLELRWLITRREPTLRLIATLRRTSRPWDSFDVLSITHPPPMRDQGEQALRRTDARLRPRLSSAYRSRGRHGSPG